MTPDTDLNTRHHELLFDVRRSVRYHMRRQAFFETWHRLTSTVAVVFSSATIATLLTTINDHVALWAAGIVTGFTAVDLVVGTARSAWKHGDFKRRFLGLEIQLMEQDGKSQAVVDAVFQERLRIEAEEPNVLRALDTICYNDLLQAMGRDDVDKAPINVIERLTAHWINWSMNSKKSRSVDEKK